MADFRILQGKLEPPNLKGQKYLMIILSNKFDIAGIAIEMHILLF